MDFTTYLWTKNVSSKTTCHSKNKINYFQFNLDIQDSLNDTALIIKRGQVYEECGCNLSMTRILSKIQYSQTFEEDF